MSLQNLPAQATLRAPSSFQDSLDPLRKVLAQTALLKMRDSPPLA